MSANELFTEPQQVLDKGTVYIFKLQGLINVLSEEQIVPRVSKGIEPSFVSLIRCDVECPCKV